MKLEDLLEQRAVAGERYRNATDELHDSLIELASIDAVLANRGEHLLTFFDTPQNLSTLAHPIFAPADTVTCWLDEIKARTNELLHKIEATERAEQIAALAKLEVTA